MDSEAQKDLALNAEDAENVVGGFRARRAQKKAQKKIVAGADTSSIMIVEPPMGPNSGPEPDGAAQSDDPNC